PGAPATLDSYVTYDLATRTYATPPVGGCNAHSVIGWDPTRQRLPPRGGGSTTGAIQARKLTDTGWTPLGASGQPPLTQEDARETSRRGGVDTRTGNGWVLADNRELWVYQASSNAWSLVPTTGTKPPSYVIAALHEGANTIVAVHGCPGINDQDGSTPGGSQ